MRLTTKGRFAVTAMIDLALREHTGPVALAAISQRQQISLSYLEQLFGKLRRHLICQVRCQTPLLVDALEFEMLRMRIVTEFMTLPRKIRVLRVLL